MDSSYINNKRKHSKEIKGSYVKSQEKKPYYSSGEDSITEEYIEEKKEIKCIPPQLQNNNTKNKRMEFRRKEFERINKNQKIFLEKIDELKSSVESLKKDNHFLEIKVFNLENNNISMQKEREDDHKTIWALKNEREDDHKIIWALKNEREDDHKTILALKKGREDDHKTILALKKGREDDNKTILALKKGREDDHKIILALKKGREDDHKIILALKKENVFLQDQIDELKNEKDINTVRIYNLEKEVKNLSSYAFSGKLRKLLKNLLNYLITYFKKNMKYDENQNKLYFTESPNSKNDIDSVKALNSILDIIFNHSTKSDHIIHYVDRRASINKDYIKNITVFKNSSEFFDYFNISKKEGIILLKYIPERYFTTINNANFESRIPDLLSKLRK